MHLQRLRWVWTRSPIYLITTCCHRRCPLLDHAAVHAVLLDEWRGLTTRHGWDVGRYVVMPDHVHFFIREGAQLKDRPQRTLSDVVGCWKTWTARRLVSERGLRAPIWQAGFFDEVIGSMATFDLRWRYVRDNPVRAGLVDRAELWRFSGAVEFESARVGVCGE